MENFKENYLAILESKQGQQFDEVNGACFDDTSYKISKDENGGYYDSHLLHGVLLDLLLELDRIFRKHNIMYALSFGSALGIYNYKGFIPWDDDIDVAIRYEDIPTIIKAFKEDLSDKYVFDCYENDDKYHVLIPTMKLRYRDSYIKEFNHFRLPNKCINGNGIFIDICAFMDVPDNKKEHKKLLRYTKNKIVPYFLIDAIFRLQPMKLKAKIKNYEKEIFHKYNGKTNSVSQTVIIPWQDYKKQLSSISFPKDVIYPFKEYDFEGHKIYSFNNIPEFCKIWWGESSLREFKDGKWIDNYPKKERKLRHAKKIKIPLK